MAATIVFDNIIFSLQKSGGISAFWSSLIAGITMRPEFDCFFVEYPGAADNLFRAGLHLPLDKIISGKHLPFALERVLEPYIPPHITAGGKFVFHSSYYRIFTHRNARNVTTVHDLTHEHGGDGNFLTRRLMRHLRRMALTHSRHTVCVSKHTMEDVRKFYPKTAEAAMSVAYNAPVNTATAGRTSGKGSWLLFVGARDEYKNFKAAVKLADAAEMPLKVAGAPFSRQELKWLKESGVRNLELVEYPDDAKMSELYEGSRCLLYLSEYEGFGIPITEAQAAGCPVMALRRSAVPEIAGNGALLIDSADTDTTLQALRALDDDTFRNRLIAAGKRNCSRFSWEATARHYARIYLGLLGGTELQP